MGLRNIGVRACALIHPSQLIAGIRRSEVLLREGCPWSLINLGASLHAPAPAVEARRERVHDERLLPGGNGCSSPNKEAARVWFR
jgi:hypothetical protein